MRVRGAAGLLMAPVFWIVAQTVGQSRQIGSSVGTGFKALLWTQSTDGQDKVVALVRDGLLGFVVLCALLGLAGRGKVLVALAALFQLVCFAPWTYYGSSSARRFPPSWLRKVPWYPAPDITAGMWIVLLLLVIAIAVSSERPGVATALAPPPPVWSPSPGAPGAPGYPPPYSPTGGVPAGFGGPAAPYPPTQVQPAPLAPQPPAPGAAQPTQPAPPAPGPVGLPPRPSPGFGPPPGQGEPPA